MYHKTMHQFSQRNVQKILHEYPHQSSELLNLTGVSYYNFVTTIPQVNYHEAKCHDKNVDLECLFIPIPQCIEQLCQACQHNNKNRQLQVYILYLSIMLGLKSDLMEHFIIITHKYSQQLYQNNCIISLAYIVHS